MLNIMTIRCDQCGHENNPHYSFCGQCGATLRPSSPVAEEPPPERVRPVVSGPSILGLGEEPTHNVDYLLEDEPSGHRRMFVALILLLAAGFLVWHWRRDVYPWAGLWLHQLTARVTQTVSPPAAPATLPAEPPATTPPDASHTTTPAEPPAPATTPEEGHPAATPEKAEAEQKAGPDSQAPRQVPTIAATVPQNKTSNLAQPQQSENAESQASAGKADEAQAAPTQPAPKADSAATAAPFAKSSKAETRPAARAATDEEKQVADGERYLYGNGVRQNCVRAQRNLLTAAQHENVKAETLAGAMYATGHCVTRDLPTAYRWFARALRQDPGNTRLARDLEILWKQMTPEERQLAQRSAQ
jgi:hypothetical protein